MLAWILLRTQQLCLGLYDPVLGHGNMIDRYTSLYILVFGGSNVCFIKITYLDMLGLCLMHKHLNGQHLFINNI